MAERESKGLKQEKHEKDDEEGFYVYSEQAARPLNLQQWAKYVGYELFRKGGKRNKRFFHRTILSHHERPVFEESTWGRIIKDYQNGSYQPPELAPEIRGRLCADLIFHKHCHLQATIFPDSKILATLRRQEEAGTGVAYLLAENQKRVPVMLLRNSPQGTSASTKSHLNKQIKTAMEAQGDLQERVADFLQDPQISREAAAVLSLPCFFDAEASVDLKIRGKFTNEQLNTLRQAGMKLASPQEIREEERRRQIQMDHKMVWLEVSEPKNEETKIIEV